MLGVLSIKTSVEGFMKYIRVIGFENFYRTEIMTKARLYKFNHHKHIPYTTVGIQFRR